MKLSTVLLFAMWLSPAASQDYTSISQAVDRVFQVTTFSYPGFKGYVAIFYEIQLRLVKRPTE
jgi:hypothetical protein